MAPCGMNKMLLNWIGSPFFFFFFFLFQGGQTVGFQENDERSELSECEHKTGVCGSAHNPATHSLPSKTRQRLKSIHAHAAEQKTLVSHGLIITESQHS